jgi:hypothetical protein
MLCPHIAKYAGAVDGRGNDEVIWIRQNDRECERLLARSDLSDLRSFKANAAHQTLLAEDECIDIRTQIGRCERSRRALVKHEINCQLADMRLSYFLPIDRQHHGSTCTNEPGERLRLTCGEAPMVQRKTGIDLSETVGRAYELGETARRDTQIQLSRVNPAAQ